MPTFEITDATGRTLEVTVPKGQSVNAAQLREFRNRLDNPLAFTTGGSGRAPLPGEVDRGVSSLSELPFGFRTKLSLFRERPQQLGQFLKSEGYALLPTELSGKVLIQDKKGRQYDLTEALPGQAALTRGPGALLQGLGGMTGNPLAMAAGAAGGRAVDDLILQGAGLPSELSLADLGIAAGTELVFEGLTRGAGGALRELTGKTAMREATGDVLEKQALRMERAKTKATEQATSARTTARARVEKAQAAYNRLQAQSATDALEPIRADAVQTEIEKALGMTAEEAGNFQARTLDDLAATTFGAKKVTRTSIRTIYSGLDDKFNSLLSSYRDIPVQGNFTEITQAQRDWLAETGEAISPKLKGLLTQVDSMTTGGKGMPANFSDFPPEAQEQIRAAIGGGAPTVQQIHGLRSQFSRFLAGPSASAVDRRVANRMIEGLDGYVNLVIPDEVRAAHDVLRQQWGQANSLFSQTFRSRLMRAATPGEVADAIIEGAGSPQRAVMVLRGTAKDDLPVLRAAIAERVLTSGNPEQAIMGISPKVLKELFPNSIASDPKAWAEAIRARTTFQSIADDPAQMARFKVAYLQGLNSLGADAKKAALQHAEEILTRTPNASERLQKAIASMPDAQAELLTAQTKAVKKPFPITNYMGHRYSFWVSQAAFLGAGLYANHPEAAIPPMVFWGTSFAFARMMESPKLAGLYLKALRSKSAEQAGYIMGRIAATTLARASEKPVKMAAEMAFPSLVLPETQAEPEKRAFTPAP